MNIAEFITNHVFAVAIILIIIFLIYIFSQKKPNQSQQIVSPPIDPNETTPERLKRGFGVMIDKLKNSDYVAGLEKEKDSAKFDDMMPKELFTGSDNNEDIWSTDPSKFGKSEI